MAKSLNRVQIIGNLGADPEVRSTQSGTRVANLRIATNERWTDRSGNPQEHTEWHRVSFFGPVAEVAEKYLNKGSRVYVEGSIRTDKWQDRDGNDRYTTQVRGRDLIMLDGRDSGDYADAPAPAAAGAGPGSQELSDDDIPF